MDTKRSIASVAEEILLNTGRPMHYRELTQLLLGQCNLNGKTPAASVRSSLAMNLKFKRVAEGFYALSTWKEYPAIKFAKDIAYDTLERKGTPVDIISLGNQILEQRKFRVGPKSIVKSFLFTDNRFYYLKSTGMVGLSKWVK